MILYVFVVVFFSKDSNISIKSSLKFDDQQIESLLRGGLIFPLFFFSSHSLFWIHIFLFTIKETLKHKEMATECFCLVVNEFPKLTSPPSDQPNGRRLCSLGDYYFEWKRRLQTNEEVAGDDDEDDDGLDLDFDDPLYVKSRVRLPDIYAESFPFLIVTKQPTVCVLE